MTAILSFFFIYFCINFAVALVQSEFIDHGTANQKCGTVERKLMLPFSYIPDAEFNNQSELNTTKEMHILRASTILGKGCNSEIFVGYFGTMEDPFSVHKCVAVRLGMGAEWIKNATRNGFKVLREMKRKLSSKWPNNIINTLDIGQTAKDEYVTVMELADKSLKDYYQPINFEGENYGKFLRLIQDMVEPLVKMHEVAIHADLKLGNYVVIRDGNGNDVIKLIDFDSSVLILPPPSEAGIAPNSSSRLDQLFVPFWSEREEREMGPEYRVPKIAMISTKTDIWTIGILIYELILLQPKMNALGMDEIAKREEMLDRIAEMYRGYRWLDKKALDLVYDGEFVTQYSDPLMIMLGVQKEMPEIFVLLSNLLHQEPSSRMSASAILDYLHNIDDCEPAAEVTKEYKLFANITCQKLEELIVVSIKESPNNDWTQKLVQMRDLLIEGSQRILEE